MGKVIALINTTPDGFCDSHYVIADAEFHEFVHGLLKDTETVGFGRNTFELFQNVWPPILEKENQPESQVKMARALHHIDKNAYSSTLRSTSWHNSAIVKKIDAARIKRFKDNNEKNLLTIGSPGIVAALTQQNLVDEYYFSIQPTIAGQGGVRLFDKIHLDTRQPLKFMNAHQLQSGVVIIHYLKIGERS
jgi:dihydrofolate reductase